MKKVFSILLALTMLVCMAGCGSRTAADSTAASTPASAGSASASGTAAAGASGTKVPGTDSIKIAFSAAQMDLNPVAWDKGIQTVLDQYDNIEYQVFDAGSTAETQTSQFEDLINRGYDAIIVNPADAAALASVATKAEEAGVNIVSLNMGPDCIYTANVCGANYETGAMCAKDAFTRLNGTGNCVSISAPTSLLTVVKGAQGWEDYLKENCPNMKMLESQAGDWTTENANTVMRDLLTKYNNDIQAVFCQNDQMAIGAAQAIEAAGLTGKVLVYGCDGTSEAMEYIQQGKMTGSVYNNAEKQGQIAAMLALYAVESGSNSLSLDHTPQVVIPSVLITPENVADYM